ncbi:MAG: hypothetical protein CM15mP71_7060 [Candidatus Poseidoniales archaeon]|nr:MAG: hypothetical protein CM15mP71_7060 [Candidatus Poseidoniales archaeon]
MVMRPTKIDRSALEDAAKGYKMGDDVDGLGGFMLEAEDGTLSFDLRFDTLVGRSMDLNREQRLMRPYLDELRSR